MRIKTFLIMVLSLASLTAFAQGGGVKGKSFPVQHVRLSMV